MDENSVSFQIFLILLSFITLGSESQILCSSNVQAILRCLEGFFFFGGGGGGEHAPKPKFGDNRDGGSTLWEVRRR